MLPQPATLEWASLSLPTVLGTIRLSLNQTAGLVNISLTVPARSTARVCLPPPAIKTAGVAANIEGRRTVQDDALVQVDTLVVDGMGVAGVAEGRMLCLPKNLTSGDHTVARSVHLLDKVTGSSNRFE